MNDNDEFVSNTSVIAAVARLLERGETAALVTVLEHSENVGGKLLIDESGNTIGSLGEQVLEQEVIRHSASFLESREETRMFKVGEFAPALPARDSLLLFERIRPEPRLVVCGAGHVGAALARLASFVGYWVTVIDDREEFLASDRFPEQNIQTIKADDWAKAVSSAIGNGKGVAVAVVTRGHNEDEQCLRAVVSADTDYLGMIGSKRRTNIVLDRLRQSGTGDERLQRVHAPIGLDIGAVSPEEVALAILAEIISERRGGRGGSLSEWRRSSKRV